MGFQLEGRRAAGLGRSDGRGVTIDQRPGGGGNGLAVWGEFRRIQDECIASEGGLEEMESNDRIHYSCYFIRSLISNISDGINSGGSLIYFLRTQQRVGEREARGTLCVCDGMASVSSASHTEGVSTG